RRVSNGLDVGKHALMHRYGGDLIDRRAWHAANGNAATFSLSLDLFDTGRAGALGYKDLPKLSSGQERLQHGPPPANHAPHTPACRSFASPTSLLCRDEPTPLLPTPRRAAPTRA